MSVLACDRNGCDNVMCDRLSHNYGYICNSCFVELQSSRPMPFNVFMDSEKAKVNSIDAKYWENNCFFEFQEVQ